MKIELNAAKAEWRNTPEGNSAFYTLALELRKSGMSEWEIQATLQEEAQQHARSPTDRLRQIGSIMNSLRKRGISSDVFDLISKD